MTLEIRLETDFWNRYRNTPLELQSFFDNQIGRKDFPSAFRSGRWRVWGKYARSELPSSSNVEWWQDAAIAMDYSFKNLDDWATDNELSGPDISFGVLLHLLKIAEISPNRWPGHVEEEIACAVGHFMAAKSSIKKFRLLTDNNRHGIPDREVRFEKRIVDVSWQHFCVILGIISNEAMLNEWLDVAFNSYSVLDQQANLKVDDFRDFVAYGVDYCNRIVQCQSREHGRFRELNRDHVLSQSGLEHMATIWNRMQIKAGMSVLLFGNDL